MSDMIYYFCHINRSQSLYKHSQHPTCSYKNIKSVPYAICTKFHILIFVVLEVTV